MCACVGLSACGAVVCVVGIGTGRTVVVPTRGGEAEMVKGKVVAVGAGAVVAELRSDRIHRLAH